MSRTIMTLPALSAPFDQRRSGLAWISPTDAGRADVRPLSTGQERLWLLSRLDLAGSVYNIAVAYRLRGPLDIDALEEAVVGSARRHETLRAAFPEGGDGPIAVIAETVPESAFEVVDVRDSEGQEGRAIARAEKVASEAASRPFEVARGPLWRVVLIRWADEGHDLAIVMHHLVSDAWSFAVLGRELAEGYASALQGRAPRFPEQPVTYSEAGLRHRRWLASPAAETARRYWHDRLAVSPPPPLRLPADRRAPSAVDRRGASRLWTIPAPTASAVAEIARREGATPFMVLLAAFAAMLHRQCGQDDLVIVTPTSGRHRSGTRDLIGYFNNLLPIRLDLSGDPSFATLVAQARREALAAFRHQDLPFQSISEAPSLRSVPLGRCLFSLDIGWPPPLELFGLDSKPRAIRNPTSDFDLFVSIWEEAGGLRGAFVYRTALFDDPTITATIGDYLLVLETIAHDPNRPLSTLPVAPRPDRSSPAPTPIVAGRSTDQAPERPTEARVLREWEEALGTGPIGPEDDLFDHGATSMVVARLAVRLQRVFGVELPLSVLYRERTARKIARRILGHREARASSLAPLRAEGSRPPLFLCEAVGLYQPLARRLGPDQPVYALFREVRRDYPRVEELAASYIEEVRSLWPDGPYHLGGLSFGGVVAFEMARQLAAEGQNVGVLALFDSPTPWAATLRSPIGRLAGHAANLFRFGPKYLRHKLGVRLTKLRRALRGDEISPSVDQNPDGLRAIFARAASQYVPGPYPGEIDLFILANRHAMGDSLYDPAVQVVDPMLGWGRVAPGRVSVHEVPGDHIGLLQEPHVGPMAEILRARLESTRPHSQFP